MDVYEEVARGELSLNEIAFRCGMPLSQVEDIADMLLDSTLEEDYETSEWRR